MSNRHKSKKTILLGAERLSGKTLAAIAGLAVAAGVAAADVKTVEARSISIEPTAQSSSIPAAPSTIVLTPPRSSNEQFAYHRSHMSHQSHQSHYSHYSSRY